MRAVLLWALGPLGSAGRVHGVANLENSLYDPAYNPIVRLDYEVREATCAQRLLPDELVSDPVV